MDRITGFLPDADPTSAGVVTSCINLIPYEKGMKGAPTGSIPSSTPALATACKGAIVTTRLDDARRILAGTETGLFELSTGAWSNISSAPYTGTSDDRWKFAQFGNTTLASNGVDKIQRSTTVGGAFANIASSPAAKIVFTVGAFVMALNTIDTTYGTTPNRWWCCALFDDTDWVPNVSTLCTTGELVASPGKITAGGRLGEYAVAYKENSIYVGQFVGAPAVFDWVHIPGGDAGCIGVDAWCDIGGTHFVVGQDNLWLFDGSRPVPIGVGQVRQWFFDTSNPLYRYKTQCIFDKQNNLIWTLFCSSSSSVVDKALVYHLQTKQWGTVNVSVEAVANYISAGITIDTLSTISSEFDTFPAYPFDSQAWLVGGRVLSYFDTSHQMRMMTGATQSSGFTTGDAGDDDVVTLLSKIRIRFAPSYKPISANVTAYTKMTEGDTAAVSSTGQINDGKFDVLQSGRFHSASFLFTGDVRIMAFGATLTPQGNA